MLFYTVWKRNREETLNDQTDAWRNSTGESKSISTKDLRRNQTHSHAFLFLFICFLYFFLIQWKAIKLMCRYIQTCIELQPVETNTLQYTIRLYMIIYNDIKIWIMMIVFFWCRICYTCPMWSAGRENLNEIWKIVLKIML